VIPIRSVSAGVGSRKIACGSSFLSSSKTRPRLSTRAPCHISGSPPGKLKGSRRPGASVASLLIFEIESQCAGQAIPTCKSPSCRRAYRAANLLAIGSVKQVETRHQSQPRSATGVSVMPGGRHCFTPRVVMPGPTPATRLASPETKGDSDTQLAAASNICWPRIGPRNSNKL
jgi:hypothetical protein